MASFKQQSTKQNLQRKKVEVTKVKVGIGPSGVGSRVRSSTGTENFKIYSENEVSEVDSRIRKSMPVKKGSTLASTSCRKGVWKSMERSKGKNDSSAKTNVVRRALADISNASSISSRNLARDSSKPSVSATLHSKTMTASSRKSFQGGLSQGGSSLHSSKKVSKDLKVPWGYQRPIAAGQTHESSVTNGRRKTGTSLIPTRKSLSVSKRVDQVDIPKENSGGSENSKGSGCPVKVKVGTKILPRVSNARMHLWKDRASDGFIIMGQSNVDSRTLSRKSIKPIVKTTLKTSDAKRNTKSNLTRDPEKLITVAKTISNNEEAVTSSLCENITQESVPVPLHSDGDCKPSTSEITAKKSTRRRRSYTSLLMEGSKLLEEHRDVTKQEKLPNIDDEGNQLEVADYVDEIYHYYWVTEAENPPPANYMSIQKEITPRMRAVLINWLIEVHIKFDLMRETLYLMITLLDRYLSQVTIKKNEMQLVGLTALLLASKYEDLWQWCPRVKDLLSISAESYTREQMLEMEKLILKKLKFRLNIPTPYVFMLRFLKAAESDTKLEHLAFYLIDLCLVEYEALMFKPSLLCASAIYVARCTLHMTPPWTPLLCRHARYEVSQLRDCAEMILRLQKAAREGQLQVTYEKYMSSDLSSVAAIKPLDKLPL